MKQVAQTCTLRDALKEGIARMREAGVPSHTLAAELLLMHATGRDRAWLYAHPEESVEPAIAERYLELVARRSAGVPTQYLTGKQEFWGLEFEVTPDVLIPRPETEHVIEVALDRLGLRQAGRGRSAPLYCPFLPAAPPCRRPRCSWPARARTSGTLRSAGPAPFSSCSDRSPIRS